MTNTVAEAIIWAHNHPTHDGGDWDGACESFVHRAGGFTNAFSTAKLAYQASNVYPPSKLPLSQVPNGWLLHWDYGHFGHIAIKTPQGALMASAYTSSIHSHLGFIDPARYGLLSGNRYLGASPDHGGQYMAGIQRKPTGGSTISKPGRSFYTLSTGKPNIAFYKRLQWYAHLNGYTGPIDGLLGVHSWRGVQRGLKNYGYTGAIDGIPRNLTYRALQEMAHQFGSKDPIDGTLSPADYKAITKRLNQL